MYIYMCVGYSSDIFNVCFIVARVDKRESVEQ